MSPDSQFAGKRTELSLRTGASAAPLEAGEDSSHASWQPDVPHHGSTSNTPDSTHDGDTLSFHLRDEHHVPDGDLAPASRLGRYVLERRIGRGGMGAVWLATDMQLGRKVAIKVLRSDRQRDPAAIDQFLDECRRLGNLSHAGILSVFDCGIDQGICYLVSEFVAGGTLGSQIKQTPPTFAAAAELVARIADAAHYAHLRGIVHRDIKPGNILMRTPDVPLLADFGLAISEEEQLAAPSGTLGTYAYMSPEQMRGDSQYVDGRADIYSLGVLLYLLLAGRLPYLADTVEQYQELVLHRDPRPPRSVREDIPRELEAICLKCLARNPVERYTTAADLAAALRESLQPRPRSSRRIATAVGLLAIAALIVAAFVMSRGVDDAQNDVDRAEKQTPSDVNTPPGTPLVWSRTDGGKSLHCQSEGFSLYRIGTYRDRNLSLSVNIDQREWTGDIGVYWGCRPAAEPAGWYEVEYLKINREAQGGFRIHVCKRTFNPSAPHIYQTVEVGYEDIGPMLPGTHSLGFEIRQGSLHRLTWDEQELGSILLTRAALHNGDSGAGSYGLISTGGDGIFARLRIDGQSTRFDDSMFPELP